MWRLGVAWASPHIGHRRQYVVEGDDPAIHAKLQIEFTCCWVRADGIANAPLLASDEMKGRRKVLRPDDSSTARRVGAEMKCRRGLPES
jgi:hypothetical protein